MLRGLRGAAAALLCPVQGVGPTGPAQTSTLRSQKGEVAGTSLRSKGTAHKRQDGESQTPLGNPWEVQNQRVPKAEAEPAALPPLPHAPAPRGISQHSWRSPSQVPHNLPRAQFSPSAVHSLQPRPQSPTPGVHSPSPAQLSRRIWGEASAPGGSPAARAGPGPRQQRGRSCRAADPAPAPGNSRGPAPAASGPLWLDSSMEQMMLCPRAGALCQVRGQLLVTEARNGAREAPLELTWLRRGPWAHQDCVQMASEDLQGR